GADDERGVRAQLEAHLLVGGRRGDAAPHRRAAREGQQLGNGVAHQGVARRAAGDDRDEAAGQTRGDEDLDELDGDRGVFEAGLSTTGQPAAMAGPTLWATRLSGKLKGVIAPTTPTGTRKAKPRRPWPEAVASMGTISPVSRRASAAQRLR